jgi:hypothetical protein
MGITEHAQAALVRQLGKYAGKVPLIFFTKIVGGITSETGRHAHRMIGRIKIHEIARGCKVGYSTESRRAICVVLSALLAACNTDALVIPGFAYRPMGTLN